MSSWSTFGRTARIWRICDWSEGAVLELAAVADGGGDLAREGDGALAKVVVHPALGQAQVEDGEPEATRR